MPKCNVCGNEVSICTCPKGLGGGALDESLKDSGSEKKNASVHEPRSLELARERMQQFKDAIPRDLFKTGKIVLLCGTSTAGKTSICMAAQIEAMKSGHAWVVDGADVAAEKAWTEPSEVGGVSYLSGQDHFVNAMKTYAEPSVVDAAARVFGARTLAVALFSKRNLGNPKVEQLDLTPQADIKAQAIKIYDALSSENKAQYTPEAIENLLTIIKACPDVGEFFTQHPYPPLEKLNEHMLERAIARAKEGEFTILDVIGDETIGDQSMMHYLNEQLGSAGLPAETSSVVLAHCPVNTLIKRMENRNNEAMNEGREKDVRRAFFPFDQYGAIYKRAPDQSELNNPASMVVTRQDVIKAANTFGKGEEDANSLLVKLGFTETEASIYVIPRMQNDKVFQSGELSAQDIAKSLCERTFGAMPQMQPLSDLGEENNQGLAKGGVDEGEDATDNFRPL